MKVLQLCYKPPRPPVDGGTLAMNSITEGLLENGQEVTVLTVESDKHPVRRESLEEKYLQSSHFESVYIDLSIHPLDAAVALLCGESYNVKRFYSKHFASKLAEILKKNSFDIIHIESIFLAPYVPTIRQHSNARIVLRAHNVEHRIWRQMAESTRNPLKRWYLKKLALALRQYELEHINDFDGIACISAADVETFRRQGCHKPLIDIPFGIDIKTIDNVDPEPNTLFHIGSMDWMPNQDGIRWFLDKVWPSLHNELPQVQLFLAGRKMPADLMELHTEGVTVVGEVPDAANFIASKQINIVPLLAGSGIRVKIIEAMSLGKTVITTSVGAAGIDYADGKNILIADTPEQFTAQVRRCVEQPDFCRLLGDNARALILEKYNNQTLIKRLIDFYNKK
ncbi:MAG: glycosyltransferase [Bacteroidales bacterium]|nr:glycosyltransferase [Bacteroidales bacterium]